ncbi:DNA polymerase-3 subunit epsilon [Modicisalibacter ilicicola DSM 19980]|uniref:DNA polymerase-3 subunit epsilon n=1 Tax=Modicisalibacter ilicicola DSM 19980 TaxID=1121942 RepID=A0A1M4YIK4_9GAMM|nr:3'-5' exonuclease [Halomonas ilicicola]SHF05645.1 DNA polymerase-3 subunit epsilon [Halomonas ilicicola DSM 19980]
MSPLSSSRANPNDWPLFMASCAEAARDPRLRRFFAAGGPAPETPIGQASLVALDLETTGLDPGRHGIVSIGVLPFSLRRIRLSEKRYWVLNPPRTLTEKSVTLHRITHSEIASAPDLDDILDELLAVLAGRLAVVHYRNIERSFLDSAVRARLRERLMFPVIDTMQLEARLHRRRRWAWAKRLSGRKPLSIRLHESRQRYHLPPYPGHHALGDALATAELLQAQIANHYHPETPVGELWS